MSNINQLHFIEKPIEKLIARGVDSLSEIELLAIILGSGNQQQNVLELSKTLYDKLAKFSENESLFDNLNHMTYEQLISIFGIGRVKACRILVLKEMIQRSQRKRPKQNNKKINSPEKAASVFQHKLAFLDHEEVHMISLNTKRELIKYNVIAKGGLNSCILDPRDVFRTALMQNAAAILLAHNHPSGNTHPSNDDIQTTKIYTEIGRKLGIKVEDHLVIAQEDFISIRSVYPDIF